LEETSELDILLSSVYIRYILQYWFLKFIVQGVEL